MKPYIGRLFLAGFCMAIAAGATAALAYLMEPVLDEVFINQDQSMLILVPIAVIGVTLIKGMATCLLYTSPSPRDRG